MSAEDVDALLGRWIAERMIETSDEPLDDYGMRIVRAIRMQMRARLPALRHPVADAFGFSSEYAAAAALKLDKRSTAEVGQSLLDVQAGDRCQIVIMQVGGRIIARAEIIRYWDTRAMAESDLGPPASPEVRP